MKKKKGIYCNCDFKELNEFQKEDVNGEGIWFDVALCFVSWKVGLAVTVIDHIAMYFVGTTVTDWIESHVSETIIKNLGGNAKAIAYQPQPVDSGYPPNSYQALLWAQQRRKLRYEKA
ncbi:hypothetical protein CWE04_03130 [Thomasclavelia cocleata]|uniref:Uncharacterized protein n=1 Tax=Thomasclavelia cocleata TaxID=69824 RepID=A0A1I0GM73_9FIRM|nr:hypothetical protein [Thomasclavelia cocleata]MCR1961369.1 hypothetical protein [Thomasclavelia cocleata]NDO41586.1 hypothetical protein [Thomasclavelia cocleata]PJN81294.1 hypothetical protein CWE04_03130 [Thomasclavelia cocleata]SET72084.1 hypothetical protein SAMN04489758_13217 [Thomasclavelia cocleata]